jgi:MFS family permease
MFLRRRLLTRLLFLDQPAPPRSEQEISLEVAANYRWNFWANFLDGVIFWFGLSFASSTTIVPLFVSKVSLNPLLIGLVAVIAQAGWYLPQLLTAGPIERLDRKKPVVINLGLFLERLPVWLWPLAAWLALDNPTLALVVFLVAYAWHGLGAGMIAPAWQELVARCFPLEKRGWFFGVTNFAGTGLAAVGAQLSVWLLAAYDFPTNFVVLFSIAAICITLSWVFLVLMREPLQPVDHTQIVDGSAWSRMVAVLRNDHNFRAYLGVRMLLIVGSMGLGFVTVVAVDQWGVADSVVGIYTAIMLVGQTVGNLLAGVIADRMGHKLPLVIGGVAQLLGFAVAWITPVASGLYLVFALVGFSIGVNIVSGILIALEFSTPARRPTYVGIANTAVGVASGIAPLIGAAVALLGYSWLFAASTIVSLIAVALLLILVADPRRAPASARLAPESG